MHHIYTTKAFILHSSPYGEAGKYLTLFTNDFGLIGATIQGIRNIKSKLRYHIQDYTFSNISLVRGKDIWRVTGAHEIGIGGTNKILQLKIFKLLRRMLHGEEKNEKLFKIVEDLYSNSFDENDIEYIEYLTVFRILYLLGYIDNKEDFKEYLIDNNINTEILDKIKKHKAIFIKTINSALKESQL